MKTVRFISLGEIVTLDIKQTMTAFANILGEHGKQDQIKLLGVFVREVMGVINQFKLGKLTEKEFDQAFIKAFKAKFDVTITVEQLNKAWEKMQPTFEQYDEALTELCHFNEKKDHQIVLFSYTNPKDMQALQTALETHHVPYKLDKAGHFTQIAGMDIHLTYTTNKTKAELIRQEAQQHLGEDTQLAMITSKSQANIPVIKADVKFTQETIQTMLKENKIPTISWDKTKINLTDLLSQQPPTFSQTLISKL